MDMNKLKEHAEKIVGGQKKQLEKLNDTLLASQSLKLEFDTIKSQYNELKKNLEIGNNLTLQERQEVDQQIAELNKQLQEKIKISHYEN